MITSKSNPLIKEIKKLKDRKFRRESGHFYIEGLRIVGEAFQTGADLVKVLFSPELLASDFGQGLIGNLVKAGIPAVEVSGDVFRSFSLKTNPQGIAAVVNQRWLSVRDVDFGKEKQVWVAVDSIQNPGNLGTILRTGDAFGTEGILLLDQSTDPHDPTAVRSSMGAIFSQKIISLTLQELAGLVSDFQIPLFGASGDSPIDYYQVDYPRRLILLMGSEREGLTENHVRLCDAIVRIPMVGRSDSLNVSIAAAVILSKIFEQRYLRRQPTGKSGGMP